MTNPPIYLTLNPEQAYLLLQRLWGDCAAIMEAIPDFEGETMAVPTPLLQQLYSDMMTAKRILGEGEES